ncbi:MAG: hypothetical protein CMF52_04190 [Legionellales bacterium]|nr:hypothetical protein [Legionellales bacterium]
MIHAILLDSSILFHHHGVKCLVLSMYSDWIKNGKEVDLLVCDDNGQIRVLEPDAASIENLFFSGESFIGDKKTNIISKLSRSMQKKISRSTNINVNISQLNLFNNKKVYDQLTISAPWLVVPHLPLPKARSTKVIALDTIPIQYFFDNPNNHSLHMFAHAHHLGYQYASSQDGFLCISPSTLESVKKLGYLEENTPAEVLPYFMPPGFSSICNDELVGVQRENTAILAAPFDTRKGLDLMPQILNDSSITKVNIIGNIRCKLELVKAFFNELNINDVTWYANASFATKKRLFLEAKVLVFPSYNEGLGLPMIEAYACGCRCLAFSHLSSNVLHAKDQMNSIEEFRGELSTDKLSSHDPLYYSRYAKKLCEV